MRKINIKRKETDHWIRTSLMPMIIGGSLVIANISMIIFKVIGWVLLIWGIGIGALYLYKLYKANKEKIFGVLKKLYLLKEKEDEE